MEKNLPPGTGSSGDIKVHHWVESRGVEAANVGTAAEATRLGRISNLASFPTQQTNRAPWPRRRRRWPLGLLRAAHVTSDRHQAKSRLPRSCFPRSIASSPAPAGVVIKHRAFNNFFLVPRVTIIKRRLVPLVCHNKSRFSFCELNNWSTTR
jgi:hypothetical protein